MKIEATTTLGASAAAGTAPERDWNSERLSDLIEHILSKHHEFLRREFPRLAQELARVQGAHPGDQPVLQPLGEVYSALRDELDQHMMKEEHILFPFIQRMEADKEAQRRSMPPPFGTIQNPIRMMEYEHESAEHALAEIRRLTADFSPPEHACPAYRALWAGLAELEADLHQHIHLENDILFPRAVRMEASGQ